MCLRLRFGAGSVRAQIEQDGEQLRIVIGDDEYRLRRRDPWQLPPEARISDAGLMAPMPGRIIAQLAAAGSAVTRGAPLLVMESYEDGTHALRAPADGTVRGYRAAVGEQVQEGAELIEFEPKA